MNLTLSSRVDGDTTTLTVVGEVDLATSPDLRERLAALENTGVRDLVLDMAGVNFCDSTGLGVLVGARKRFKAHGGGMTLVNVQDSVRRVFELTGLIDTFGIDHTVDPMR
jgi:anti-sigma B factor antagonist